MSFGIINVRSKLEPVLPEIKLSDFPVHISHIAKNIYIPSKWNKHVEKVATSFRKSHKADLRRVNYITKS